MPQVTITGILSGTEISGNKTTFKIKKDESRKFPDWYIGFFERQGGEEAPRLKDGQIYSILCDEVEREGKKYLNYASHASVAAPPAQNPAPTTARAPEPPRTAPSAKPEASTDAHRSTYQSQFRSVPELNRIDAYKIALDWLDHRSVAVREGMVLSGLHRMALEIAEVISHGVMPEPDAAPPTGVTNTPVTGPDKSGWNKVGAPAAIRNVGELYQRCADTWGYTGIDTLKALAAVAGKPVTIQNIAAEFGSFQGAYDALATVRAAQEPEGGAH